MHNHSSSFQPASALLPTPSHPSPFTIIHYLKESCQLGIILEESSKHLITPWPYNPWPFTLLLFTHHCYPILPRSLECNTLPQAGSLETCLSFFSYEEMLHFVVLVFPRTLITFVSELFNVNPVWTSLWGPSYRSMLSRRNKSASYLFLLLKQLEMEVHAFRVTVIFVTENSFDLSLIFANSAAD